MTMARPSSSSLPLRVEPFREVPLPRPRPTPSGLFPATSALPPAARTSRLRRAVALAVVLGTVGLLAYVSWQRVAQASRGSQVRSAVQLTQ